MMLKELKTFSIDIQITDQTHSKRKILLLSSLKENYIISDTQCKIRINNYPLNHWTNLIINLKKIMPQCFKDKTVKYVDHVIICAGCKIRRIFLMKAENDNDDIEQSLLPKGLILPLSVDVYQIKLTNIFEGLKSDYEYSAKDLLEIEKVDNKTAVQVKQNGGTNLKNVNVVNNQNNYLNPNSNSKQIRSKSINKPNIKSSVNTNNSSSHKWLKENGIVALSNSNGNKDNLLNNDPTFDNENEIVINSSNNFKQRYESLNKKTKSNLQFAKNIPKIEQINSQIKYDVNGRKIAIYNNNGSNINKNFLNQSPKDKRTKQFINLHKQTQNGNNNSDKYTRFNNFMVNGNEQTSIEIKQTKQMSPVPVTRKKQQTYSNKKNALHNENNNNKKTSNYVSDAMNYNNNKETNPEFMVSSNKFSSALNYNVNNSIIKPVKSSILNDSIEEICDYNENNINGNLLIEDSLLENGSKYIQIDNMNNKPQKHQIKQEKNQFDDMFDDLYQEDTNINPTIITDNNRPFTPPIAQIVPVKNTNDSLNEINDYKDLIYDENKKCFYNPKTKVYYDIKH